MRPARHRQEGSSETWKNQFIFRKGRLAGTSLTQLARTLAGAGAASKLRLCIQSKVLRGITGVCRILAATAACKVCDWLAYMSWQKFGHFGSSSTMQANGLPIHHFISPIFPADLPSRNQTVWESSPPDVPIAAAVSIRPRSCPRVTDKGQLTRFALEFGVCRAGERFNRMGQTLGSQLKLSPCLRGEFGHLKGST